MRDEDLTVGLAVLCHDFGKPASTRYDPVRKRIRSLGHDEEGVAPTLSFLRRLTNEERLLKDVPPLVRLHMRPFAMWKDRSSDSAIRRLAAKVVRIDRLIRVAAADAMGVGSDRVSIASSGSRDPNPTLTDANQTLKDANPTLPDSNPTLKDTNPTLPDSNPTLNDSSQTLTDPNLEPLRWLAEQAERLRIADSAPKPLVQGRDLIALGMKPGVAFGTILKAAYEAQLDGRFFTREEGVAYVQRNLPVRGSIPPVV